MCFCFTSPLWGESTSQDHDFWCLLQAMIWTLMSAVLKKAVTHWGRVMHICVSKIIIIGSDNGLSPGRRQFIIWTNAAILLIGPLGINFSEIFNEIQTFSLKKLHLHTMDLLWEKFQWILPLYMKPVCFQSKASVVCSVTAAIFIDFCLKKLNVFSQYIGKKTNEYLNSA